MYVNGPVRLFLVVVAILLWSSPSPPAAAQAPAEPLRLPPPYEVVARTELAPGNVTVTPDGRIIVSLHQFFDPPYPVAEVVDGRLVPFPGPDLPGVPELDSVLGLTATSDGVVWLLDNGMRSDTVPQLVGWDTRAEKVHRVIELAPPATVDGSFVNDLVVDERRGAAYVADPANGSDAALVVVDLDSGEARRVLQGHRSVVPERIDLVIDGVPVEARTPGGGTIRPHVGVNPIAHDPTDDTIVFGPMHGRRFWKIPASVLADPGAGEGRLMAAVERHHRKPICDGIAIDERGTIYLGDLAANAVAVVGPSGDFGRLARAPELAWVDAFDFAPDGRLIAVANQLHRSARLNRGVETAEPPFLIIALRPVAPGR